ncbi:unnamed protein product [Ostreobium quekettii]|uniref:Ubiquitin-like modifier-activating enzyme ATG7 n=1 Tax=Ostreobium quekettii TaxID=121088 RepID=A0A8S1JAY6_9CHLO|nr:unnamed protein product [Ostreobium quekettii]
MVFIRPGCDYQFQTTHSISAFKRLQACFVINPLTHCQSNIQDSIQVRGWLCDLQIATACDEWRGMGSFVGSETAKSNAPVWMLTPPNGAAGSVQPVPLTSSSAGPGDLQWPDKKMVVAMSDPCHLPANPGWILRNVLILVAKRWTCTSVRVVCIRERQGRSDPCASIVLDVNIMAIPNDVDNCVQHASGWEANQAGKSAPRLANLRSYFDPVQMAEQAVDLNLRLMLWRAAPNLDTRKIADTKCLLLGMGTLGCAVSRTLVGWGVRHITCVDSGRVAFSNPARQSLYEFEDCLEGGKPKAECAAQHLKRIFPALEVKGVMLTIPMPGHPATSQEESQSLKEATEQLHDLVMSHDVVFLLTDTREARWLPSVLCTAFNKIAIDIALGFDNFLVMRHGSAPGTTGGTADRRLGCYFCNDVVAPLNSTADRALDQQCTVARPGLAPIASSLGVELLAAMIQHPEGIHAPALRSPSASNATSSSADGPLGGVPHMIRGQLSGFSQVCMEGRAFSQCTACSLTVVEGYLAEGWDFVQRSLQEPKFLEDLTGLTALHQVAESMANFDIDDSEAGVANKACHDDEDGWTTL